MAYGTALNRTASETAAATDETVFRDGRAIQNRTRNMTFLGLVLVYVIVVYRNPKAFKRPTTSSILFSSSLYKI